MINRLLYRFTARRPCRLIRINDRPYLERYYLGQLFGVTFYLHRFVSSDSERHLHNHPWGWGRALVLSGGYVEESVVDISAQAPDGCITKQRSVTFWNKVDGNYFHRIATAQPGTWTLFMHGPRVVLGDGMAAKYKGWGFLEPVELCGGKKVVAFIPYEGNGWREWWKHEPIGKFSRREPLSLRGV